MKTRKQKVTELSKIGFSDKLMSTMNESQINTLYKKLVSEQEINKTLVSQTDTNTINKLKSESFFKKM